MLEDCYHASPPVVLFLEKTNSVILSIPYVFFHISYHFVVLFWTLSNLSTSSVKCSAWNRTCCSCWELSSTEWRHKIIASFALYTKLPLKHLRMRFVFFLLESHFTDSYSVPPQLALCCTAVKWLRSSLDQHIWCLYSHCSWSVPWCSHLCRGQPSSPVSHAPLRSWWPQAPCLQEGLLTPAQLPPFWCFPLVCCPTHRIHWAALEAEHQGHDPPS